MLTANERKKKDKKNSHCRNDVNEINHLLKWHEEKKVLKCKVCLWNFK